MPDVEQITQDDPVLLRMHLQDTLAELHRLRAERSVLMVKVEPGGRMPTRAHRGDAGFDLYTSEPVVIPPRSFVDVPTAVSVQMPPNMWGQIVGRSSTLRRRQLLVNHGIIDQGYRGELFAGVWNLSDEPHAVEVGERLAQLILVPLTSASVALARVESLDESDRGSSGFGSTGT